MGSAATAPGWSGCPYISGQERLTKPATSTVIGQLPEHIYNTCKAMQEQ